ncbi:MAG: hypothetical protein H6595_13165 [Flavobacteriales bacterium]|nr:hypothetical protein [Flavobacteriales bacterium]MCB9168415.1 hypothetical protein [Flavobacteriales bacterium]
MRQFLPVAVAMPMLLAACCNCDHGHSEAAGLFGCSCNCDAGWTGDHCELCTGVGFGCAGPHVAYADPVACICQCETGWTGYNCATPSGRYLAMDIDTGSADIHWATTDLELTWSGDSLLITAEIAHQPHDDWIDILICDPDLGTHPVYIGGCSDVLQKLGSDIHPFGDRSGGTNAITITKYVPPDTVEAEFAFALEDTVTLAPRELFNGELRFHQ